MIELNIKLPKSFLEEEVRCGYVVTKQMKEVWAVELDLLLELDRVCKKHSLVYFADGGTILGAVRHQGFIPWDDDIDITMSRDDYEKLCSCSNEFKEPYFFQTNFSDKGSLRGHAQLRNSKTTGALKEDVMLPFNQGIFIDIFPIDNMPDDENKKNKQIKEISKYKNLSYRFGRLGYKIENGACDSNLKKIIYMFLKRVNLWTFFETYFYEKFERECKRYNDISTEKCSLLSFQCTWERLVRDNKDYSQFIMMPFEFIQIPIPIGYEKVLTNLYGDYHQIVMNSSAHGDVIFDTDISYKVFLKKKYNNIYY